MNITSYNRRQTFDPYVTKRMYLINTALLLCHILFCLFFKANAINLLYYFSWFSIATYIVTYFILYKKLAYLFIATIFFEIFIFVLLATLSFGWDYGFQLYCFSFMVAVFFCDYYVNKKLQIKKSTIYILTLNIFTYFALRIWTHTHAPLYSLPDPNIGLIFHLSNAAITFAFVISYLSIYGKTVFHLEKALVDTAYRDPLTGLRNRRRMQELLTIANEEFTQKPYNICIAMVDIDHFKQINDTYGHDAGDEVLVTIANIFLERHNQNNSFHACRWGGEEFLIFYRKYQKSNLEIYQEFESIRQEIEQNAISYQDVTLHCTVTIGLSFNTDSRSISDMIKHADENLYKGKEEGRNRVII